MATWTSDELGKINAADELRIVSLRQDAMLNSPRTIWVVRLGDDLYVRSVNGRSNVWFRGTQARHECRDQADGIAKDVRFEDIGDRPGDQIDAAYRTKYRRYAKSVTDSITSPQARAATIRLVPR